MGMMENNGFSLKTDGADGRPFRIELAQGRKGRSFMVRPLGRGRFELLDEQQESMGTIQLDEKDNAHCESHGCELDMPLLHAIRDQIQFHLQWKEK
jgi:hypothetical protein